MKSKHFLIENHIGLKIRYYRMSKGYSMRELAEFLSVTQQQVQKYEKGIDKVKASRLMEIANFLEIPINEFFPKHALITQHKNSDWDNREIIDLVEKFSLINSNEAKSVIIKNMEIFVNNNI
jgi:transcriptional regulator with XRE-family HTH domain